MKKRVSVKDDQGVVKWVMCDVTSLVCPAARQACAERFSENDSEKHENDMTDSLHYLQTRRG